MTILEALKGMDKLFLLTPTHPQMIDLTSQGAMHEALEKLA